MNSGVFVTYLPAAYIDRNLIYFIDKMYFKENEDMLKKEEFEIVQHTTMNYLEIFLVEMTARSPHGHGDLEIGILLDGSLTLFTEFKQHELHAVRTKYLRFRFIPTFTAELIISSVSFVSITISSETVNCMTLCTRLCCPVLLPIFLLPRTMPSNAPACFWKPFTSC